MQVQTTVRWILLHAQEMKRNRNTPTLLEGVQIDVDALEDNLLMSNKLECRHLMTPRFLFWS